ncbi:hypothetical protein [Deinococcus yunweiensis]|uniref:hypothetical protein n=1 Tax=Deinococcus yunweiensis TaxID=367282 RepID=UPI00398F0586
MKSPLSLLAACTLALTACQTNPPNTAALQDSAQFYVDHGGLAFNTTADHRFGRPCLDALNMKTTLLGGPLASPDALVDFVEQHKLATTVRTARPSGYTGVTITPLPPYEANWVGKNDLQSFCFGTFEVTKVEPVPDAEEITAGSGVPYLIPGTRARSYRLTFKLTDLPAKDIISGLKANPALLNRAAMLPADYGQEFTVVAVLPTDVKHFNVTPE